MSRRFAADTAVAAERTQAEINVLLAKHGATARAVGIDEEENAFVTFALAGRRVRVEVPLHKRNPTREPRGWTRWRDEERKTWAARQRQQEVRSTWRGLLLLLRAKLEAVEGGYSSVEREFLADVLLPGGKSVGQMVTKVVETAYMTGMVPPLLPAASA